MFLCCNIANIIFFFSGKPSYEMYESDPDWAPSLYLGHNEVKASSTATAKRRANRDNIKSAAEAVVVPQRQRKKATVTPEPQQEEATVTPGSN